MTRQDHKYVNLNKNLVKIVDICFTNIVSNGEKVYLDRKDFITKATQQLISKERENDKKVDKLIKNIEKQVTGEIT